MMPRNLLISLWVFILVSTIAVATSHSTSSTSRSVKKKSDDYFMKAGEKVLNAQLEEKKKAEQKVKVMATERARKQSSQDAFRFSSSRASRRGESGKGGKGGSSKSKGGKGGKGGTPAPKPGPAPAPAPAPKPEFRFPSDATCVMCEFVVESILRKVKSKPSTFQPNAPESMMTDFGGTRAVSGEAVYRTYQGVQNFLEIDESRRVRLKTNSKASILQKRSSAASKKSKGGKKPKEIIIKPPVLPPIPPPPRPAPADGGKILQSDFDRIRSDGEKNEEFEVTYKNFMDAMDDVCYHEMPPSMTPVCAPMYKFGDRMVEMYLHGYDDWEICSEIPWSCPTHFFEAEGVTPHRI